MYKVQVKAIVDELPKLRNYQGTCITSCFSFDAWMQKVLDCQDVQGSTPNLTVVNFSFKNVSCGMQIQFMLE